MYVNTNSFSNTIEFNVFFLIHRLDTPESRVALAGTLGVAAIGVNPVQYHAWHSGHVTQCLPRGGETFSCLHLKQEVTVKHLASQDSLQAYQKPVNRTRFVSTVAQCSSQRHNTPAKLPLL